MPATAVADVVCRAFAPTFAAKPTAREDDGVWTRLDHVEHFEEKFEPFFLSGRGE